jgi:hypothetical protein
MKCYLPEIDLWYLDVHLDVTARTLRNADDFRLPRYQKTSTQNMIWHNGLRMFNALPPSVKHGRNLDEKCQIFEIMRELFPVWTNKKIFVMLKIICKKQKRNLVSLWDSLINSFLLDTGFKNMFTSTYLRKNKMKVYKLKKHIENIYFVDFRRKICFYFHFKFSGHFKFFRWATFFLILFH